MITVIANNKNNTIEISDGRYDIEVAIPEKYMQEAEQHIREQVANYRNLNYAPFRVYLECTVPLAYNYKPKKVLNRVKKHYLPTDYKNSRA